MNITIFVLVAYLVIIFFIAWIFSRKESAEAYFINKRKTNIWLMTFSTVATVVGAGATVGIVSEAYNTGISYGIALPISLVISMCILGLAAKKIKEVGDKYGARTIVDFFEKRFDTKNRNLVGIIQLFLLSIWIAVQAIAVSSLASVLIDVDYNVAIFVAAAITISYTAIGGLRVDIITDFVQFWIITIVFVVVAILGYQHIGSLGNLFSQLPASHLDPFAFGGISWSVGIFLVGGFLLLGNTSHWQRIFSAENELTAKRSFFFAAPIALALGLIILFIGLLSSVLLPPIEKEMALFALMDQILPPWLVGAGFAAILAVIMSSIDSLLVGGSTIIHKALFKDKDIGQKKELRSARILTGVFGIFGFVLAFFVPNIITLSLLVTYLALIFVPPVYAGLYSKKTSPNAGFYSILVPSIALFVLFPILKENVFIVTTLLGIIIITLYDRFFPNTNTTRLEISSD